MIQDRNKPKAIYLRKRDWFSNSNDRSIFFFFQEDIHMMSKKTFLEDNFFTKMPILNWACLIHDMKKSGETLFSPPPSPLLHPLLFLKLTDGELCYWVLCRFSNDAFNARQKDKCPLAPSTLLFSYFVRRAVVRGGPLFFSASATAGRMYRYESINYRIVNRNRKMFL